MLRVVDFIKDCHVTVPILSNIVMNVLIITAVSKDGETVIHNDMTYSLRHVEESWIHLLKAGKSIR